MAEITGSEILARALKKEGTDHLFFIMGGPMIECEGFCRDLGIRMIDVRHEQAAAMMGNAWSRLTQRPSVCMAASGPGVINLCTGVAHAYIDCAPMVICGGSSSVSGFGKGTFQDIDQVAIMQPMTKFAERVYKLSRIPEQVHNAFERAVTGKPGPVYLDFPGDLLHESIDESKVDWSKSGKPILNQRPLADPESIDALIDALNKAKQPIIISGSGVIWSRAWNEMREFVERAGIPFYTTPQGRGVLPDDHKYSFLTMRSQAFKEADLIIVIGTRMNYIIGHASPPRFNPNATIARIDIDAEEIASAPRYVDIGLVGDCKAVLGQVLEKLNGKADPDRYANWRKKLADGAAAKREEPGGNKPPNGDPIHPLELCDAIKNFMRRDAILVVDGQEILNYGRQWIPTYEPGHRLNSGPFGTMGVGLPFGLGAKLAKPDKQVIVLHGDGSFGINAMEIDTAVRHNIPVLIVISLNGGWTADPNRQKAGRELGYSHYEKMGEAFGCYGEYVERPEDITPALQRAQKQVDAGKVAIVNVKTDFRARAGTVRFASYAT
ncbi:MAG TPA: thiamine pyrophosphate-binding protein [Xanthobacteraceae bacterium]|nr:thiamine pyrophosphate-binding protein [Xanthobacteraceae bacterium]